MSKRRRGPEDAQPTSKRQRPLPPSVLVTSDWFIGARVVELPVRNLVLQERLVEGAPMIELTDDILSPFVGLADGEDVMLAAVAGAGREWLANATADSLLARLTSRTPGSSHAVLGPMRRLYSAVAADGELGIRAEFQAAPLDAALALLGGAFGLSPASMRLVHASVWPLTDFAAFASDFLNARIASFDEAGATWFVVFGDLVSGEGGSEVTCVLTGPQLRHAICTTHGRELGILAAPSGPTPPPLDAWLGDADARRHFAGGATVVLGPVSDPERSSLGSATVLALPLPTARPVDDDRISPLFAAAVASKAAKMTASDTEPLGTLVVMGYPRTVDELFASVTGALRAALGGPLTVWTADGQCVSRRPASLCHALVHPPSTPLKSLPTLAADPSTWHVVVLPLTDLAALAALLPLPDATILSETDGWSSNLVDTARVFALPDAARAIGSLLASNPDSWPGGEVQSAVQLAALLGQGKKTTDAVNAVLRYAGATVVCPLTPTVHLPPLATARTVFAAAANLTHIPFS